MGMTEAFLSLAAVSSCGTLEVMTFIILDNRGCLEVPEDDDDFLAPPPDDLLAPGGGCSSTMLSRTGLVKFSGGREY